MQTAQELGAALHPYSFISASRNLLRNMAAISGLGGSRCVLATHAVELFEFRYVGYPSSRAAESKRG